MIYLLLLFSSKGIFDFLQIIKKKAVNMCLSCIHASRFATFWWFMRLAPMIVIVNPSHHLIRLSFLFLSRWHVCSDLMWFDLKLLFFFPFLFLLDCVLAMQKII